jgi:hypothetical protein
MSDATPPAGPAAPHPFPPPPPPPPDRKGMGGCMKAALIGCGGLAALLVLAFIAFTIWISRHGGDLVETARVAEEEGARFGLETDEAGCLREGIARGGEATGITGGAAVEAWLRSCLEYSRETPGFCEDVPRPTAIRRSAEWLSERCGADRGCIQALGAVPAYCADGRPKRSAEDTLAWPASGPGALPAEGGGETVEPAGR